MFDCRTYSNQVLASIGQAFNSTGPPPEVPAEFEDVINPADAALYSKYEFKREKMMMIEGDVRAQDHYDIIITTPGLQDDHTYAELPDNTYDAIPNGMPRQGHHQPIYEEALIRRTYNAAQGRGGDNALYSRDAQYEVCIADGPSFFH